MSGVSSPTEQIPLRYSIWDPSGNITALVESEVPSARQPAIAAALMRRHPAVEQVGFVRFSPEAADPVPVRLRMAGGEFCGNASMSAAALSLLRRSPKPDGRATVMLRVSGAGQPVEVQLSGEPDGGFHAGVRMPQAREIRETPFAWSGLHGMLPLVRMEGISHILLEADSPFFRLKEDPASAEQAVKSWCAALAEDGLGLMFLEKDGAALRLTPLVYVPGSETVFWENSCASGSSAVGMALAARSAVPVSLCLEQPGGPLRVESDPVRGETWLYGKTRLIEQF